MSFKILFSWSLRFLLKILFSLSTPMKLVMVYLYFGIGNQTSIKFIIMLYVVEQEVIIKFLTVWDVSECTLK